MLVNITKVFAVDHTFNYQGELLENNLPSTGIYNFKVQAYTDSQGNTPVGTSTEYIDANAVTVTSGLFNLVGVDLGMSTYDGMDIWLQISVKKPIDVNYTALTPLQKMQSVPYATTLIDKGASDGQVLTFDAINGWQPADDNSGTDSQNLSLLGTSLSISGGTGAIFTGWDTDVSDDFSGSFSDLTNIPGGLADGDDNTLYSGADFALSSQSCGMGQKVTGVSSSGTVVCAIDTDTIYSGADFAVSDQACSAGQTITGVTNTGAITCADMVQAPPTCEQNNQSLQYNSGTGWACVTKNHNIVWSTGSTYTSLIPQSTAWANMPDLDQNPISITTTGGVLRFGWNGSLRCENNNQCAFYIRILVDGVVCGNQTDFAGFGLTYRTKDIPYHLARYDVEGICNVPSGQHNLTLQFKIYSNGITQLGHDLFNGKFLFWVEEL